MRQNAPPVLRPTERSFGHLGGVGPDLCAPRTFAGTPEALAAARAGNLKHADDLELAWRNAWRILPDVPEDVSVKLGAEYGMELMALDIHRGAGPDGETLIAWALVHTCPRCWRRLALRASCHKCGGQGHTDDEVELFYADLDGNLVEPASNF